MTFQGGHQEREAASNHMEEKGKIRSSDADPDPGERKVEKIRNLKTTHTELVKKYGT